MGFNEKFFKVGPDYVENMLSVLVKALEKSRNFKFEEVNMQQAKFTSEI